MAVAAERESSCVMAEETHPLRILLADDHVTVRHGLKLLIDAEPDMKVIGEASDGDAAFKTRVDVEAGRHRHGHLDARA